MSKKFYEKSHSEKLDLQLFKNPTKEYRGTPFWSWNTRLNKGECLRQIDCFKDMGFGGYHVHARSGLDTEYLGKDFMDIISACNEHGKKEDMIFYMYDEDRYASGQAGGFATKYNPELRARHIRFSFEKDDKALPYEEAVKTGRTYLLAQYDIKQNEDGTLADYKRTDSETVADGYTRMYAYCLCAECCGWNNGGADLDRMNVNAVKKFLDITFDAYYKAVGKDFEKEIPSMFTDEPNTGMKRRLKTPFDRTTDVRMPWTLDLAETFKKTYGFDILDYLPEISYDLPDGKPSYARYAYFDHTTERFVEAFGDYYADYCEKYGINMTGHILFEDSLSQQAFSVGECMRFYRKMQWPGIDVLVDCRLYTTAKQTQSMVHQYGKEAMASELYGVTGWECRFMDYKSQGDWQAAHGVTVRVPHLAWLSMRSTGKRDYPASIGAQSPWYKEFSLIEDHFARLNTVLTRGKPVVNVAVIHPIESMWMVYGPESTNKDKVAHLDYTFNQVAWDLVKDKQDFNYICEATLPDQVGEITDKLTVGCMQYSAVVVPPCFTLRSSTIEILEKYVQNGGKLLFIGEKPKFTDGKESNRVDALFAAAEHGEMNNYLESDTLKSARVVQITDDAGVPTNDLLYCMRNDGDSKWLFITHTEQIHKDKNRRDLYRKNIAVTVDGEFDAHIYNTMTGEVEKVGYDAKDGKTTVYIEIYDNDSPLIRFTEKTTDSVRVEKPQFNADVRVKVPCLNDYTLDEENVLLLDKGEYKVDDGEWQPEDFFVPLNHTLRRQAGYEVSMSAQTEPWTLPDTIDKVITLRMTFDSKIETPVSLCYETGFDATLNGKPLDITADGFFVDFDIHKSKKFMIAKGTNVITIKVPFSKKTSVENLYLTGDFGVELKGGYTCITEREKKIGFGAIKYQGLPFYTGNITYKFNVDTPAGDMRINCKKFAGTLARVFIDGKDAGAVFIAPYILNVKDVAAGTHTVEIKVYGNRENAFGRVHNCKPDGWYGPGEWYPTGDAESYEYCLADLGQLHAPVIEMQLKK